MRHAPDSVFHALIPAGLHDISDDGLLAELLARLQPMQPFHQDETFGVLPHHDRALQADLEDALGDLLRLLGIERRAPLHRHADVGDSHFTAQQTATRASFPTRAYST